jgi:2-polyprenyl-3-methyl-5-hydroxy-6-metoxy-1,4-benzoquinol methylase
MPVQEDIGKAYQTYYTHPSPELPRANSLPRRLLAAAKAGYLASKYGYPGSLQARVLGLAFYLDPGRRQALDYSVMYLPARSGGRLLDIGAGSGLTMLFMRELGWLVEGVDFDASAVEAARQAGLLVRLGTLEEQRYPSESFDAIVMAHVVEHVHEPQDLLAECYRLLAPGGRLVVATPNTRSWGHRRYGRAWRGLEPPRHLHLFNPVSLLTLAQRAGFKRAKASTSIRGSHEILLASRYLRKGKPYVMGAPQPRAARAWGRRMQFIEWALTRVNPRLGEEIILIGVK